MYYTLLDLFCGAGGCSVGYSNAGFGGIVGVDNVQQPRYPFEFVLADAVDLIGTLLAGKPIPTDCRLLYLDDFSAIHASPPCQKYARTKYLPTNKEHRDMIGITRELLLESGKPFVIENVMGAPLVNPTVLNGPLLGLPYVHRERQFECHGFDVPFNLIPPLGKPIKMGRRVKHGDIIQPVGNFSNVKYAREAMGIDWMTQKELSQAIPPAYTEYIGKYLLGALSQPTPRHSA